MFGTQLELFGDRHLRLEDARRALAEGRLEDACGELAWLRRCHPDDAGVASELDLARGLLARVAEIDQMPPDERPGALVELAHASVIPRAWLLRRAAAALHQTAGPVALLGGRPASALFLEAGDPHTAWAIAADAVSASPRARFQAYLADVEHRLDQRSRSRARYREALAIDPFDVDWDELADDEVKALPDIARTELEIDDGVAWAAPVGVVIRVLPVGEPPPPELSDESPADPSRHRALRHARCFLGALIQASRDRGPAVIHARRQMRALAPQLLAAYLAPM